ncbi:hypothetical protein [Allosphingosinicella vermicomposti]|uniref:hypothetical protein n=1 Tax=Allosphingosinicella vermicomposti TaxID=614671 RepID=UPI000D1003B6|nr:hypothetical protein [Allosphingosinicella vermicomposti]
MTILRFLALAALTAAPAQARDWWLIGQSYDFASFIDADSIEGYGESRTADLLRINFEPNRQGEKTYKIVARWNCARGTFGIRSARTDDEWGSEIVAVRGKYFSDTERPRRGTVGRAELDFVCRGSWDAPVGRRSAVPPAEAVEKALELKRIGFRNGDAFALATSDVNAPDFRDLFRDIVPPAQADEAARIVGFDNQSGFDSQPGFDDGFQSGFDDRFEGGDEVRGQDQGQGGKEWRREWDSNPR